MKPSDVEKNDVVCVDELEVLWEVIVGSEIEVLYACSLC